MKGPSIAIPSRSPRQVIHRSWTNSKPPKSSTSKPLNREISKFRIRVVELQDENDLLRSTLTAFSTIQNPESVDFLLGQFQSEISEFSKRLDERSTMIASVSKKLGKTKPAMIDGTENQQEQKKILMAENHKLVARALYLEKQMIAAKLRLRLNHDHRDLSHLRRVLNKMEGGGGDYREDEEITENLKAAIGRLRDGIEAERERIRIATLPDTDEYDAAVIIQKNVRGFLYRISHEPIVRPTPRTERQEEEEGHPHEEEEEEGKKEALGDAPAAAAEPEQTE